MIIDWELSIKLAGGNQQAAEELMTLMIKSLPNELSQIKIAVEKNQLDLLKNLLHKLHGALCYCGLPRLKNAVERFEDALKKDKKHLFSFYLEVEKAINEISDAMPACSTLTSRGFL